MEETKTKVCKCCGQELPIEEFARNAFGYTNVCKNCNSINRKKAWERKNEVAKLKESATNARELRLHDFTPRELMTELKRRGYDGKITYTETHTIDLSTI